MEMAIISRYVGIRGLFLIGFGICFLLLLGLGLSLEFRALDTAEFSSRKGGAWGEFNLVLILYSDHEGRDVD